MTPRSTIVAEPAIGAPEPSLRHRRGASRTRSSNCRLRRGARPTSSTATRAEVTGPNELPRLQDDIKATARSSAGAITASTTWTFEGFTRTWACDRTRLLQAHNAGAQRSSAGGNPCNELLSPVAAHGSSDRLRTAAGRTVEALADKPVGPVCMAATRVDTHIGTWRGASHPPGAAPPRDVSHITIDRLGRIPPALNSRSFSDQIHHQRTKSYGRWQIPAIAIR